MIGTLLNVATILLGGLLGLLAGSRIPTKFRETLISAMGLFTLAYGISMFGETANILIPLASLVLGTILGEWLKIEDGLEHLGTTLQAKVNRTDQALSTNARRFVDGFVTASLLFCIGPMAILGAIQDGISGDFQMLAVKAVLDGLAAMAFASTLGVGVLFSAAIVLIYQGAISLLAQWIGQGFSTAVVNEMSAVGGVILAGIAISNLLEVKKIRTGSFLPALFIAIAIVLALNAFGVVI